MEHYRHGHHAHHGRVRTSHLTKLYSDVKKSAATSIALPTYTSPASSALNRKYRIQKDRLIAWGLAWSDDEKGPDGNIDESVARAGLTETVDSVLRNIKEVTEEAERMSSAPVAGGLGKDAIRFSPKQQDIVFDEARYEDLLRDLTTSIDTLYDLSESRRALARGEHPSFSSVSEPKYNDNKHMIPRKGISRKPSYASSATTLINPSFSRPALSPYAGLPARIDLSALRLPAEGPPPYEAVGVPSTTRMVARLLRQKASESVQNALGSDAAEVPVLVEFATFDPTYRDTGVPPPLQRLEVLASVFQPMRAESQTNLSLLGFFEDPSQPRIGLVYDLPYSIQNRLHSEGAAPLSPLSLLKLVQKANKTQSNGDPPVPALEDRFRLALRLTEQLHALHAHEISHGNINSSGVIFTTAADETPTTRQKHLRSPLWAAFDLFSKCNIEGITRPSSFNIYKHPGDHPGMTRDFRADMKFDLYGLGLVLLEIGLWLPIADLYKSKYTIQDFKLRIEKLWIPKLSAKCGSAYMHAAEACLQFSDESEVSKLNVEAIYGVLLQYLRRCCLLDDVGTTTELIPASELQFGSSTSLSSAYASFSTQHQSSPVQTMMPRQLSEPSQTFRETAGSIATPAPDQPAPQSFTSVPTETSFASDLQLSRPTTLQNQLSPGQNVSNNKNSTTQRSRFSSSPSMRDFKRKITLIQRKWRECRAFRATRDVQNTSEKTSRTLHPMDTVTERRIKRKRKEYPATKLPQTVIDDWHNKTCFELQLLVQKALKGSPESSSIALTAYGETPETARPTFLVCCTSTAKVKHILKRHFKFDTSIYDVRVKKDEIRRCRRSRRDRARSDAERSMAPLRDPDVEKAANPDYQERPVCGASIGAFRDDEHLPPVSFGGIVLVDGRPYGMSVHHMLEANDDDREDGDNSHEQAGPGADDEDADDDDDDSSSLGSSDGESILSSDDDEETVRPPSMHPSEDGPSMSNDKFGDCPGIVPGDYEEITITQPALDDAIDLDLHVDEDEDDSDSGVDEDHLLSYKLGQVHASSGLRRTAMSHEGGFKSISQSLPQEIDWALFELEPPRFHPYNIVKGGKQFCPVGGNYIGDSFPVAVKKSSELACAKVHCLGRTSGLGCGVISSTMELVKIHGRSTFSASWTVDGDFGVGGDSGAWVISNDDGRVCGHVVAARRGKTYICPMDLLLQDIQETLGAADVTLPINAAAGMGRSSSSKREEKAVVEAIGKMRLAEHDASGGVALPVSPHKHGQNRVRRQVAPV